MAKKHKKKKAKQQIQQIKVVDDSASIKKEIEELENQKKDILSKAKADLAGKTGFKKFGTKLGYSREIVRIDKEIAARKQYLSNKFKIKSIHQQNKFLGAQRELDNLRKETIKPISMDDIFGF